jgi:hypothetical protein
MTLVSEIDGALVAIDAETTGEVLRALGDIERIAEEVRRILAGAGADHNAEHAGQLVAEALELVREARLGAIADVPRQTSRIRQVLSE